MTKRSFKTIAAVTLVICMLFAVCGVAFAQERMITSTTSSFVRDSNTKGTATLVARTSNVTDPSITSIITLQEAPLGTTNFVNSNVDPEEKSVSRSIISHIVTFNITTTKEYRVKMVVKDVVDGITYTNTIYENLQ